MNKTSSLRSALFFTIIFMLALIIYIYLLVSAKDDPARLRNVEPLFPFHILLICQICLDLTEGDILTSREFVEIKTFLRTRKYNINSLNIYNIRMYRGRIFVLANIWGDEQRLAYTKSNCENVKLLIKYAVRSNIDVEKFEKMVREQISWPRSV
jgi:hypothetical protein